MNGNLGGTMRLGAYDAVLAKGSKVAEIYGTTRISERHRHRYEVNTRYRNKLEAAGLRFSGLSPDGLLPEIVEIPDHPWFIGVQFHPELKSRPFEPHPLSRLRRAAVGVATLAQTIHLGASSCRPRPCAEHPESRIWRRRMDRDTRHDRARQVSFAGVGKYASKPHRRLPGRYERGSTE